MFLYPFVDRIIRAFVFVCPGIFDVVIMIVVVERGRISGHRPWKLKEQDDVV